MKAILDTNFIVSAIKNKIQLVEALEEIPEVSEIVVPLEVLTELEKIMQSSETTTQEKESAELAEFMIKKKNLTITPLGTPDVDAGLVRYCAQNLCILATLDRNLKEKIRQKSPKTQFLTIKEKKRIALQ
jgi:rRNA-processing protein FCF1